ncbi:quaternary amine ABC transporter ATP-binding protein [Agrococcus carbonis]|uniref:Glycine betaine/proline transport system ATP-binding protein n=1 Tax=Agrococcus carbonis TaxID=684552 RepID=A0A1H1RXV9_9MICO|nr:glycine betaine/L-proline ABC transporter ATP-binding protein [Agrococcus carbonis]SDS40525.1 glycine betaine/proline transport system ATP-binding protein [Agrococcus carbonis]
MSESRATGERPAVDETVVRVEHLTKVFGRRAREAADRLASGASRDDVAKLGTAAVIDASFEVRRGEIFVVMGLSGSGKSTLIRMLNGLLDATSGTVEIEGERVTGVDPKRLRAVRRSQVSMVFQHFALLPHRTVLENVAYGLEIQGVERARRLELARDVVRRVGLEGWEQRLPSELSGGMQQRVGIARALCADTPVLLMDEAFSALDPLIRREMQEQLVELQAELGKTIVFITHDLNEAMFLGDRIAVMRDGRIVQIGTPEEILTDPANDYVAQFVQDVDRTRVLTAASVMEPPAAAVPVTVGPRGALRTMRDMQISGLLVTGTGRKVLGAVKDRDVLRAIQRGVADLGSLVDTSVPTVAPDTSLSDLPEIAITSGMPIAVVGEDGRLLGVIPRVLLLAALGNVSTDTSEFAVVDMPPAIDPLLVTQTLDATEVPDAR